MSLSINKRHLLVNHKFLLKHCQQDEVVGIKRRYKVLLRQKYTPERILSYTGKQFIIDLFDRCNKLMLSIGSQDFDYHISYYLGLYEIKTLCKITGVNLISTFTIRVINSCESQLYRLLFIGMWSYDLHIIDFKEYLLHQFTRGNFGIMKEIMLSPKRHYVSTRMIAMAKAECLDVQNLHSLQLKDLATLIKRDKLIDFLCESNGQLILQSGSRLKKFNGFINPQELLRHFDRCRTNDNLAKLIRYIRSADMQVLLVIMCQEFVTAGSHFAKTYPLLYYTMTGSTNQFNEFVNEDSWLHTLRVENAKN